MKSTKSNSSVADAWAGTTLRGPLESENKTFDDIRFGFKSIRERYRENPGRMLRCIDPFSLDQLVFSTPLQYENWTLRTFDPSIVYVDSSRDTWDVLHHGQILSVEPHLHWAGWTDHGVLELVAEPGREAMYAAAEKLEIIARAYHMRASLRLAADVRSDPPLLNLLDRMRQCLVVHKDIVRDNGVIRYVMRAIKAAPVVTRGDLMSECVGRPHDLTRDGVDAVLFWLRRISGVLFDIEGGVYDDRTAITAA
jgi:hypothetical protein